MRKTLGFLIVIALATTPVMAQKVTIDYAHDYDYDQIKTFQYVETGSTDAPSSLMDDRVESMIKQQLKGGGLEEVGESPDLYVTYHYTSEEGTTYNTTNFGYGGYGGGWGGWGGGGMGMGASTTRAMTYTIGTLIIDAYDAAEKKMVWRGTGTVTVKAKPEKQIRQVENILTKLGKRWDKILHGQDK